MECDHEAVFQALARDARDPASEERLAALDAIIARFGSADAQADRRLVARALHDKVRVLFGLGRPAEAAGVLEELRARFRNAEPELRRWVCAAHFGSALELKGPRVSDRIDVYAVALEVASAEPAVDELAAEALYNMGACGSYRERQDPLSVRSDEALRELERRFLPSRNPEVARWVAAGLFLLAGRFPPESKQAGEIFQRVADAYGGGAEELQQHAVGALGEWGRRLMRREPGLALEVWDRAWARFQQIKQPAAQATLAASRLNRALILGQVRGAAAEIEAYEEMIETFWDTPWPMVQRWLVSAAENEAITLADDGRAEEARRVLGRVLERFGPATEPAELVQAVAKASRFLAKLETR